MRDNLAEKLTERRLKEDVNIEQEGGDKIKILSVINLLAMSRRRNRQRSLSNSSRHSDRPLGESAKMTFFRSTAHSVYTPREPLSHEINLDSHNQEHLYNRHLSQFRDNFNQNDTSQLPFMSSLREKPDFKSHLPKTITICSPFDAALKKTANQTIKKRISDFAAKQTRLSPAFYRWHNKSGRNNKWSTEFQCSLREYGGQCISPGKDFYPYVKPIVYKDTEPVVHGKEEMICNRHKSFNLR